MVVINNIYFFVTFWYLASLIYKGGAHLDSFHEIYRQHYMHVYRFILSLSRNKQIAEEITQDSFVKALENFHTFRGQCSLNVWLCQIAKNNYFTYLKKSKRLLSDESLTSETIPSFEEQVIEKDQAYRILSIAHHLLEPYKEVFILRLFGELSFLHISQLFGKSESWARVTYYRAKQEIFQQLQKEEKYESKSMRNRT